MDKPGHYPPPNFDSPPPNSFQLSWPQQQQQQQTPGTSNFHPSMWTWSEGPGGWNHGGATGNSGSQYSYGQSSGRGWYQGYQGYVPPGNRGKKHHNKREPDFLHFCDTCDRGFKNQEKYEEHIAQHVKCSVRDCSFTGHEKIVSIHWKNTHAPGKKRIKLDTPEEIAKWREERRKNYPTVQNVERKQKLMEGRERTGAVLETAQFGRMRGRGRGQRRGRVHQGFRGQRPQNPSERPPPLTQPGPDRDPLGALAKSDNDSDKDEAAADSRGAALVVAPKQMSSALGSLVANYGSMSESESDDGAHVSTMQRTKELLQENKVLLNQDSQASRVPHGWSPQNTPNNPRGRGGRGGRRGRVGNNMLQKRRPTLLEMLLAPDIRHERNVLLQCVRYVVQNNFFQPEVKTEVRPGTDTRQKVMNGKTPMEVRTASVPAGSGGRSSVNGVTASHRAGTRPTVREEEEMGIGRADPETNIAVNRCSPQNAPARHLHRHRLSGDPTGPPETCYGLSSDKADSGVTSDQVASGTPDGQTGLCSPGEKVACGAPDTPGDPAGRGPSSECAGCEPPVDQPSARKAGYVHGEQVGSGPPGD